MEKISLIMPVYNEELHKKLYIKLICGTLINMLIIFIFILPFFNEYKNSENFLVSITNFTLLIIVLLNMLILDEKAYSLNKIFYMFSYFFLCLAPMLQFNKKIALWKADPISEKYYILANILLIGIHITYYAIYTLTYRIKLSEREKSAINKNSINKNSINKNILYSVFLSLIIILLLKNPIKLFYRGSAYTGIKAIDLIIVRAIITSIFMNTLYYLYVFKGKKRNKNGYIIIFLGFLIVNPIGYARFYIASLYVPLLFLFVKYIKKTNVFVIVLSFGLLYIFPLLNKFRNFDRSKLNELFNFNENFNMFTQGHFDSYQMLINAIRYNFITNGEQLTGVLGFFIPRILWHNKPFGSGYTLAHLNKFSFDNISMNYFGEGYVNFGYLGVLVFTIFLGWGIATLDKIYWKGIRKGSKNLYVIFYYILMPYLVFFLRGDMMSTFAFIVGYYVAFLIMKNLWCRV